MRHSTSRHRANMRMTLKPTLLAIMERHLGIWVNTISRDRRLLLSGLSVLAVAMLPLLSAQAVAQEGPITVTSAVPSELNPDGGGAPQATPAQAAAFAWQEFIALNWPAVPQKGQPGQRDTPSTTCLFGDKSSECNLLVWETYRHKVEIFPGNGNPFAVVPPPGYPGPAGDTSFGYDALPVYNYSSTISACDSAQSGDTTPWINLDETDQITLASMYAGVVEPSSSPGNSSPQLIRFLAGANRTLYVYVAGNSTPTNVDNQWWLAIPSDVVNATKTYLEQNQKSPPAGSTDLVSVPNGTIEVKAGWRPLNPSEVTSGRYHTQTVRFYEHLDASSTKCYRDATWGLVALHIIQKTPSAPYFIYATFEQADNILTASGQPVEDENGNIIVQPAPAAASTPQVCLVDPQPPSSTPPSETTSKLGMVILTDDPTTCQISTTASYCGSPGSQLYYHNEEFQAPNTQPADGNICVNKRDNAIPDYAIMANTNAHTAISTYLDQNGIDWAPWLAYKLINVQYFPYDKILPDPITPNGSLYTANPPYTAINPAPSSYYQANIVVETNRSLQLFSGGLSPNITTEWNTDGTLHKNSYYGGHFYNMGGCMGCHGSQGQNPAGQAGDFSVILARGQSGTAQPEAPALQTSQGMSNVSRNRTLVD